MYILFYFSFEVDVGHGQSFKKRNGGSNPLLCIPASKVGSIQKDPSFQAVFPCGGSLNGKNTFLDGEFHMLYIKLFVFPNFIK